jgi:hypothetical protein
MTHAGRWASAIVLVIVALISLDLIGGMLLPQQVKGNHGVPNESPAAEVTQWPLAAGWWCWPAPLTPGPHSSRVGGPRERQCFQPEVDHLVYGKPWPGEANNDGVIDD